MDRNNSVRMLRLPDSILHDVNDFVEANGQLPNEKLVTVLDAYLSWNGIVGFTAQILSIVEATKD